MRLRISKKIIIYISIFFLVGTFNNKKISKIRYPNINEFKIVGLSKLEENQLSQDLYFLKESNMFFIKDKKVIETLNSNNIVEKFSIFKNYPSNLIISVKKTKFLAYTKKNNLDYYVGSNGNLVKIENDKIDLPFIFGNVEIKEFLKLKKIIDKSKFNFSDIKNFYYFKSKRWDIETKDNLMIKLPIDNLDTTFEKLLKIYRKKEFINFKIIDLRLDNQVILNG